jgi:hypothetical protein
MSRYQENEVEFFDRDCLMEALTEMGLSFAEHQELTELEDYMGRKRKDTKAHIIVPRSNWAGSAVNDTGFEYKEDGSVVCHADEFFTRHGHREKFLNPLTQRYAELKTKKTSARMRLRVSGEETLEDGTRRLRLRR